MQGFWAFLRVCALNVCVPCIRVALYVCLYANYFHTTKLTLCALT